MSKELKKLRQITKEDKNNGNVFLSKSTVERFSIPLLKSIYRDFIGDLLLDQIEVSVKKDIISTKRWMAEIKATKDELQRIASIVIPYIPIMYYEHHNGATFKLTTNLVNRLKDFSCNLDKIPCEDVSMPYSVTSFDFGDDQDRHLGVFGDSRKIESVIIIEGKTQASLYSETLRKHYGISASDKVTFFDFFIYDNDVTNNEENPYVEYVPHGEYFMLLVPDKDMSVSEMIDLNKAWLANNVDKNSRADLHDVKVIFEMIFKVSAYLDLKQAKKVVVRATGDNSATKISKQAKQLRRPEIFQSYIRLGSSGEYVTISDTNSSLASNHSVSGNRKRPHLRRGVSAVRYVKKDGVIVKEKRLVRSSIIHKEELSDEQIAMLHAYYELE
ncbi:hypothetical protein [Photobacterium kishitanii]|uniref:Uncharacterized protein n=1 Tax=Photobacterium kishitanii TaxID=318456 RepID=A0A2T3KLN4_9GAMM|nr:hypothetical protein [Photobacterium kishitanii]PSV00560.1 hypothetical protein C9J27_05340 [Photobacterium kishitanii]